MRVSRLVTVLVCAALLAACGAGASASSPEFTADPQRYLLSIDQLVSPGFTVYHQPHHVIAAGGSRSTASIAFTRDTDLAVANGPVDVEHTVERFSDAPEAADVFARDATVLDATQGAVPMSTGPLGDQAHADSLVRTTSSGVQAVQITLEWRVTNLLNVVVIRGRYGGTRLEDALILAQRVTATESATR
jgi:hypothetical protein